MNEGFPPQPSHHFHDSQALAYLKNEGQLEHVRYMAGHASPRTTKLYDQRAQEASLDEVERRLSYEEHQ